MSPVRIREIAMRDFVATVSTRAFVIGLLLMPAMFTLAFTVLPRLMNQRTRPIAGEVAVIDETGRLASELTRALSREAIAARRAEAARRAQDALPEPVRSAAPAAAAERILGDVPDLTVVPRDGGFDRERERRWLLDPAATSRHLAVVVLGPAAMTPDERSEPVYEVYVPANLDSRVETAIYEGVRAAVVAARTRAEGLDAAHLQAVLDVPRPQSTTMAADGDRPSNNAFARTLPFVFVSLMFMGVMIGGQGLLTSTVEEKSSRVIEVLLSAVSPLEMMTGKLLGQLLVGLVAMGVYIGLGLMALTSFASLGLLDLSLIVYLVVFWLVSYLFMGSVMLAIGAAVNDIREAQSLMMPVTMTMMLPWLTAAPILQNPSSTFATTLSFIPPVNTFAMLLRLTSTAPPPSWQVWVTVAIGLVAAGAAIWCASKIYRVGLLMYGKPPNIATLVRWIRAA